VCLGVETASRAHKTARQHPSPPQSDNGKKGIKAFGGLLVAAAVAAGAYLLNEKHQVVKTKPEPAAPAKKGGFSFGKK